MNPEQLSTEGLIVHVELDCCPNVLSDCPKCAEIARRLRLLDELEKTGKDMLRALAGAYPEIALALEKTK
jgi:hypothetical protein